MLRTKKKHNNRKNIKEAVTYICSKENLVEIVAILNTVFPLKNYACKSY